MSITNRFTMSNFERLAHKHMMDTNSQYLSWGASRLLPCPYKKPIHRPPNGYVPFPPGEIIEL